MIHINESFAKYMAGLLDADGSLSFQFSHAKDGFGVYMRMTLVACESIDREGAFIKSLPTLTGLGFAMSKTSENPNHSIRNEWRLTNRTELNLFLPWIIKHMVIKGQHWQWMLDVYSRHKGAAISQEAADALRAASEASRLKAGPIKPKSHPTWAWVAGYFDGDGCYKNRFDKKSSRWHRRIVVEAAKSDRIALDLLLKAFGGALYVRERTCIWSLNLGPRNRSLADKLLPEMAKHTRLKKHKIEQLINYHRQRLNDSTATAEAIVRAA